MPLRARADCGFTESFSMKTPSLSLQLYSLRRETAADAEATLRQVPALGFDGIELAGDYGWSAERWRALLDAAGLAVAGAHVSLAALETELPALVDFHKSIGNTRLVVSSVPNAMRSAIGYREAAKRLTTASRKLRGDGFAVLYHNHAFEFEPLPEGAGRGMEILLGETDAADVQFEVDTFWVEHSGGSARGFLEKHAGRVGMLHAKELRKRDGADVPAGQGDIDFRAIMPMARAHGWPVVVEYEGENAIAAVRESAAFLRGV